MTRPSTLHEKLVNSHTASPAGHAGGRTHLMSPAMVAAAAINGHLTDPRNDKGAP